MHILWDILSACWGKCHLSSDEVIFIWKIDEMLKLCDSLSKGERKMLCCFCAYWFGFILIDSHWWLRKNKFYDYTIVGVQWGPYWCLQNCELNVETSHDFILHSKASQFLVILKVVLASTDGGYNPGILCSNGWTSHGHRCNWNGWCLCS